MKLDTTTTYILENDCVKLIPLQAEFIKYLLPFSENEPNLWNYSLTPANGWENLEKYISAALEKRSENDSYPFIVFDKKTEQYAGSTRFYDIQHHHNTVQIGYTWYGKDFQGTGLNKNCKFLLLEFAFETIGVERVEFRADALNERSIAAMKSIGCIEEGILRQNCASVMGRRDSIVFSILKDEWFGSVKERLRNKIEMKRN